MDAMDQKKKMEPVELSAGGRECNDGYQPVGVDVVIKKEGHSFFGCCCDSRRAVIITDIILIVVGLIGLAVDAMILGAILSDAVAKLHVDDTTKEDLQEAVQDVSQYYTSNYTKRFYTMKVLMTSLVVVTSIMSLFGAMHFNWKLVVPNVVCLMTRSLATVFVGDFNFWLLLLACFYSYPHVVFCVEVRNGIMSKKNYPKEEQSCCCVKKRVLVAAQEVDVAEDEMDAKRMDDEDEEDALA